MSTFEQLHPALQHHVVNSLQWRGLRPLQEESIPHILKGEHALLLAPTAGGKTEAAMFPLLSKMLQEDWNGLSVLYLCPIKALLNNLQDRLEYYTSLVGRRCAVWHSDVKEGERNRIRKDPPDVLLTTPESLEAMLISTRMEHQNFFSNLQVVVVDEIHAFAGDDRGWHLLAVLERISACIGKDIQRIGCSATVGNPVDLVQWLSGNSPRPTAIINPPVTSGKQADVQLDYVGSLENAAIVISRIHRGEKRLVFCDSRARVEKLSNLLRSYSIETFVSHSSLSADERRRAELAFSESRDCVIVATSALELGIDVGDLDRVIQIDAPSTVSSFLQRMGRTGRRKELMRNCLFLATSEHALLQAAALISLWGSDYVEPVEAPPMAFHLLAQQILALLLERRSYDRASLEEMLKVSPPFRDIELSEIQSVITHMLEIDILAEDQGILWFGVKGEKLYGFRHFIKLSSIFDTPPMFSVRCGSSDLGFVDEITFQRDMEHQVLLLSGRSWLVNSIDWKRRVVYVEPTEMQGRSNWAGAGPVLSYAMSDAIRNQLLDNQVSPMWSKRAAEGMLGIRRELEWVRGGELLLVERGAQTELWTFAGMLANNTIALLLQAATGLKTKPQNLQVTIDSTDCDQISGWIKQCGEGFELEKAVQSTLHALQWEKPKFGECLPDLIMADFYMNRYTDAACVKNILERPLRRITSV